MTWTIHQGDALETLRGMESASFDAVLCDPPYGLSFMGKAWDHGVPSVEVWAEVLRVLKPGAFILAFGGTRTFHRLICAIEDAGFEIRDCVSWVYATGFPKSHNFGCRCAGDTEPYSHGEPAPQHDMRPLRETHLPQAIHASDQCREAVQPRVSEQGASKHGSEGTESSDARGTESGLEGRHHLQAEQRELHRPEICSLPGTVHGDGQEGRLHHGAPAGDGEAHGASSLEGGSGPSRGPRHQEQRAGESGAVAGQPEPQSLRSRAACPRCGKPASFVGYGTALKPAWEPCIVAMKPLDGTFAENALEHGVAGLNIEAGRIEAEKATDWGGGGSHLHDGGLSREGDEARPVDGRWPANLILDDCKIIREGFPTTSSGVMKAGTRRAAQDEPGSVVYGTYGGDATAQDTYGDSGSAARFFYCAKANRRERDAGLDLFGKRALNWSSGESNPGSFQGEGTDRTAKNFHPCLKPLDLNRYLASLILPPKRNTPRRILVPFSGSGSEMIGALLAGWDEAVGIEHEADYCAIAEARMKFWTQPGTWELDQAQRVADDETFNDLPLFQACAPD